MAHDGRPSSSAAGWNSKFSNMATNFPQKPLSILLVEDDADTAFAIGRYLMILGHVTKTAGSVEEAVKAVVDEQFDLIFSDVGLPDGNGVSLIHGIRRFCDTPAVALTGYTGDEDAARCIRAGFNLHLSKPVNAEDLQTAICSLELKGSGPQ